MGAVPGAASARERARWVARRHVARRRQLRPRLPRPPLALLDPTPARPMKLPHPRAYICAPGGASQQLCSRRRARDQRRASSSRLLRRGSACAGSQRARTDTHTTPGPGNTTDEGDPLCHSRRFTGMHTLQRRNQQAPIAARASAARQQLPGSNNFLSTLRPSCLRAHQHICSSAQLSAAGAAVSTCQW